MRQAGTLPKELDAQALADYLLTEGIETRLEEHNGQWALWVFDEDKVQHAAGELENFRNAPDDPRYEQAARDARKLRRDAQKKEQAYRRNVVDLRTRGQITRARRAPLVFALLVTSVVATVVVQVIHPAVFGLLAFLPEEMVQGQVWRLITPVFVHGGVLHGAIHLLFNMYWMVHFGTQIEARQGTWRLLLIFLLTAILSNLAQYLWSGPNFAGMSGVVYGLFGYVWVKMRYEPLSGYALLPGTAFFLMLWLVICFTGAVGNVANMAHGGGLVVGAAIGYVPVLWRRLMR